MLTPLKNIRMEFGQVEFDDLFAPDCEPGDWQFVNVPISFAKPPHVILTASDQTIEDSSMPFAAVVGVAQNVGSNTFRLAGRNSDCGAGIARMNWLALLETSEEQFAIKQVRMGVLFPRKFMRDCKTGDWNSWEVKFSEPPFSDLPTIFATAADRFCEVAEFYEEGESFSAWIPSNYATPAVAVARKRTVAGFSLTARNPDPREGWCNFNYLAVRESPPTAAGLPAGGLQQIWVDSGQVPTKWFKPCSDWNAWNSWHVTFDQAFLTPPTVLVTALHPGNSGPAVVGMASYVTPNGFLLRARNSDCVAGAAGFNWVAFGCLPGCA